MTFKCIVMYGTKYYYILSFCICIYTKVSVLKKIAHL